jgi:putative Mg2+ transporter-C (MgtC) family protein
MELPLQEAVLRLFLSFLLGSVVGMEREYTQQSAGLRTHILVCLGATIFMLVSISDMSRGMHLNGHPVVASGMVQDPSRVAAQIVSGIGFIGGGAVLRHGANIRGLTTAASLWTMASIGMLIGVGDYQLAIVATFFAFLVLFIVGALERSMFRKYLKRYTLLKIQITSRNDAVTAIEHWLEKKFPKKTTDVRLQRSEDGQTATFSYTIDLRGVQADVNALAKSLNAMDGVFSASIKVLFEDKEE